MAGVLHEKPAGVQPEAADAAPAGVQHKAADAAPAGVLPENKQPFSGRAWMAAPSSQPKVKRSSETVDSTTAFIVSFVSMLVVAFCLIVGIWMLVDRGLESIQGFYLVSMTADIIGLFICLALVIGICVESLMLHATRRLHICFVLVVLFEATSLYFDEFTWLYSGLPQYVGQVTWSNACLFISVMFIALLWWFFMLQYFRTRPQWTKIVSWVIIAVFIINVGLVLATALGVRPGLIFTVDTGGIYHPGQLFPVIYTIYIAVFIGTGLLARFAQSEYKSQVRKTFVLAFIPVLFTLVPMPDDGVTLTYVGMLLALVIIVIQMLLDQSRELALQEQKLAKQRADIMLSQIQPHFLYNSLTAIMGIEGNPPETVDALAGFAHYLRGNLKVLSTQKLITMKSELDHLQSYLKLEKLRFGDRLTITWDIETTDFLLPPLTVQILAENAVKHGLTSRDTGGTLAIAIHEIDDAFVITVADDGVGFDVMWALSQMDRERHVGLFSVINRVKNVCDGDVEIKSTRGVGTTVTVTIPKGEDASKATGAAKVTGAAGVDVDLKGEKA